MRGYPAPRLRTRLTALTTLLCVSALVLLGAALITMQARSSRESTRSEIEYAMRSTNAAVRTQMSQITRVIRDLRNDPSFAPFWAGEVEAQDGARKRLEYSLDLYSDQNTAVGGEPFLVMAVIYRGADSISCAYYPATQEENRRVAQRLNTLCEDFLLSGEESRVFAEDNQIYLLARLYSLDMEPLGAALFCLSAASVQSHYEAIFKYEGALFALRDRAGALLAGSEAEGLDYLSAAMDMPFGITVEALVPVEQIERLIRPALFSMTVAVLILLPVIALISFAMAYYFSKPLKVVADKIGRVEAGDYSTRLALPGWEEFKNIEAHFNSMTDTIRHLVTEVYEKQLLAKESEIKFLQSQMNPHFMYNVLTMIAITAKRNGDEEAYQLLHSFSSLSRGRVFTGSQRLITLGQELELVNYYLFLQCKRYEDLITYRIDCDETLREIPVPRLCIEPIAENAFLHGMEPRGVGRVEIKAERVGDALIVTVIDDGVGFETSERPEGVGISNTRKILQNLFGADCGVDVKSAPGAGTTVTVRMPAKGGGAICGA